MHILVVHVRHILEVTCINIITNPNLSKYFYFISKSINVYLFLIFGVYLLWTEIIHYILSLRYDQAADALRRVMGIYQQSESYQSMGRLTVALVLVQLAREDCVAAEKAFKEWGNCCDASEVQTLERLLQVS